MSLMVFIVSLSFLIINAMQCCIIDWLTDKVLAPSVEKSEEPELEPSVSEPVSTLPSQAVEPLHSTEQSSEPVQLATTISEVPPESTEHPVVKTICEPLPESVEHPVSTATSDELPSVEHPVTTTTSDVLPEFLEHPVTTTIISDVQPDTVDHPAVGDETGFPETGVPTDLSVTPVIDLREDSLASDDPNARGVRIYTDTTEGVPQVERDVQETEEVLPDGTVVRRQVVRTSQRQTISTRVVMEGPEDILPTSKAEAEQLLGEIGVDEELGRQIAPSDTEPQASTNVEEHEEVLPDGSIVKRRVVTTTKQHVTTERVSLEDDDIPAGIVAVG